MTHAAAQPTDLKAPIRVFLHPDTGSRITYLGTIHAAQPAYYQTLTEIIEGIEQQGGRIYFERVTRPTDEQLAAVPEEMRWGARVVGSMLEDGNSFIKEMGLSLQKEALPCRESWEVHDLDMLGVAQAYGQEELRRMDGERAQSEYLFNSLDPTLRRALVIQTLTAAVKVVTGEVSVDVILPGVNRQIATQREAVVLAALDQQLTDTPEASFALVWGTGHLPSFTDALSERGYKQDDEQWITAIDAQFEQTPPA